MSKLIPTILLGSLLFFSACRKDDIAPQPDPGVPCLLQTENPTGRSYNSSDVVDYTCTDKHCGMMPLSSRNYWVYEDSVYNNGTFVKVQYDTLRFVSSKKSSDGLVWWESNMSVGLPTTVFSNDSAFFSLAERMFMPGTMDVRKDYCLFPGDSLRYLGNFEDMAANGRSLKLFTPVVTPAGSYNDCIYFEKNARNFRKDQVYFKPGIGVLKYIHEQAPMGSPLVKLQQVLTLVKIHIE